MIHPGFGNTSGPPFPIQANRQIQMIRIEIHHQFNCCFRQEEKGNVRNIVSAGNLDVADNYGLDCLTGAMRFPFPVGIRQTTTRERLGRIDPDRECFGQISGST